MKAKSQKSSSTRRISNNFSYNLYNNFLGLEFSFYATSSPIGLKWKVPKTFKAPKEFNHRHFFIRIFCHKILFLESEQRKQLRNFHKGNAW
jgi:hypothetical protein